MYQLTREQSEWIKSLHCERLHTNIVDSDLLLRFQCDRNGYLEQHISEETTIESDRNNHIAYYLVRDSNLNIIMYFSLMCGVLYEEACIMDECLQKMYDALINIPSSPQEKDEINKLRKEYKQSLSLSDQELNDYLYKLYNATQHYKKVEKVESEIKELSQVRLVERTYPAIEIGHFCKNDNYEFLQATLFPTRKLGEVIFWFVILPIIQQIQTQVGCQYIYLFADEQDENRKLTAYYSQRLKFKNISICGVHKPRESYTCKFMCQDVNSAIQYKEELKNTFNSPNNVDDI